MVEDGFNYFDIIGSVEGSNGDYTIYDNNGDPMGLSNRYSKKYATEVARMVAESSNFKHAYAIFSQEPDKSWLTRLEQIPYMVLDASSTWYDDHGWSNKAEDKQAANYQFCMEQIAALLAEYQGWKNSLPSTQVDQQSVVGYNSAITGQNVGASSIPNVGVSTDPSSLASTNGIEVFGSAISTASSLLSSISGGALSWLSQFVSMTQYDRSQTNTERQTSQAIANSQLANNLALAQIGSRGIEGTHGYDAINETLEVSLQATKQNAEMKRAMLDDYTTLNPPVPFYGSEIQQLYDRIANLKFNMVMRRLEVEKNRLNYEDKLHQYNSGYLTDDPESFGTAKSSYEKSKYAYDEYVQKSSFELLKEIAAKSADGSIVHSYMLDNILTGIDITSLAMLSVGDAAQTVLGATMEKLGIEFTR